MGQVEFLIDPGSYQQGTDNTNDNDRHTEHTQLENSEDGQTNTQKNDA